MKKLFLFTWMMMLSIVAMAQTIIVVDKDGNRVPYDPSKIISVEFQTTPPGFTINMDGKSKRRGLVIGKTAKTKKALVQLTEDSTDIEIFAGL
jgi:hypothetical protein